MRLDHALDPVERAADDARLAGRDAVGGELLAYERSQLRQRRRLAVQARRQVRARERALQVRQQLRIGIAVREIARARGNGSERARGADRRAFADPRTAARLAHDDAAAAQLSQPGRYGNRAQPDFDRQAPDRRQRLAGRKRALGDGRFDALDELRSAARGDSILFQISHQSVL